MLKILQRAVNLKFVCGVAFCSLLSLVGRANDPNVDEKTSAGVQSNAEAGCSADGAITYLCGPQNVEDLIHISGTDWVLASHLGPGTVGGGGFFLVNVKNNSYSVLVPDMTMQRKEIYSACPGAPDVDLFSAHGISIRHREGGEHEVYAINHGGRESVEIFDLDTRGDTPTLTWVGCVLTPDSVSPNAVTYLPEGGIAITSFGMRNDKQSFAKMIAGEPIGTVAEWSPADGWSFIPDTIFSANNGILSSEDGKKLYITGWGDGTLNIVTRQDGKIENQSIYLGEFHPDNIRYAPDGSILVTEQMDSAENIFKCAMSAATVCPISYRVLRVNVDSFEIETLVEVHEAEKFGAASAAIIVDGELLIGSFRGNRIARFQLGDRQE